MTASIISFIKKNPEDILEEIALKNANSTKKSWLSLRPYKNDLQYNIKQTIRKIETLIASLTILTIGSLGIFIFSLASLATGLFLGKGLALTLLSLSMATGVKSSRLNNKVQDKLNNFYKKYKSLYLNGNHALKSHAYAWCYDLTPLAYRIIHKLY